MRRIAKQCVSKDGAASILRDAMLRIAHQAEAGRNLPMTYQHSANYAMQLSKPCRILSSARSRPMKTRRLSRFSSSFHGRW